MKDQKLRPESTVRRRCPRLCGGVKNTYRLLRHFDTEKNADIYSLFLTTEAERSIDEEFLFDIARTEAAATSLFKKICALDVTACTLLDAASDLFADDLPQSIC